jgi:hypothetical protein
MKPSSGIRLTVRPYVPGMTVGIGPEVGTTQWYADRIDSWSETARQYMKQGHADLAASYARSCFLYAALLGHYSTLPPQEIH